MVINVARQSCIVVKEALDQKPAYTARNTIDFLNTFSKEKLRTMGIKYRITAITWSKKFMGKHQHIDILQEKVDIMLHQVKSFKGLFIELFQKGLSLSWDEDGKIIYHFEYPDLLVTKLD